MSSLTAHLIKFKGQYDDYIARNGSFGDNAVDIVKGLPDKKSMYDADTIRGRRFRIWCFRLTLGGYTDGVYNKSHSGYRMTTDGKKTHQCPELCSCAFHVNIERIDLRLSPKVKVVTDWLLHNNKRMRAIRKSNKKWRSLERDVKKHSKKNGRRFITLAFYFDAIEAEIFKKAQLFYTLARGAAMLRKNQFKRYSCLVLVCETMIKSVIVDINDRFYQ